jgi:hypothetical protein
VRGPVKECILRSSYFVLRHMAHSALQHAARNTKSCIYVWAVAVGLQLHRGGGAGLPVLGPQN